jgi:hypothetical protein
MLKEHEINKLDLFIKGWYIDTKVCDDLIDLFNQPYVNKIKGRSLSEDGSFGAADHFKKSTDAPIPVNYEGLKPYFTELKTCTNLYERIFPWCPTEYFIREDVNIQKYNPGDGFYAWHAERAGLGDNIITRHLVFMTYLNDVDDGGTEFLHQKLTTKAEKGLTLIWPSDWTYTHRGQVSYTQEKYIITGWFAF